MSDKPGKVDAVINLAARAGVRTSITNPWVYLNTNILGTLNLMEFCRQKSISKFILASTSSLYRDTTPMPFKETAETDQPIQPYAASKKGAEALCYTYHYLYDLDVTIFRYFTVYGPAGRPDMVMFRFHTMDQRRTGSDSSMVMEHNAAVLHIWMTLPVALSWD